jgi:hypothetical protein
MKKFYSLLMLLFAALAVSAENPTLYLRGGISSWNASDEYKFTENNGVYTLTVAELSGEFKIADASWSSGANFGGASNIEIGTAYTLTDGGSNCTLKESAVANATLTFTLATKELVITGAASEKNYELYLLGGLNNWTASDDYKFTTSDYKVYTLSLSSLPLSTEGGFQIADESWSVRYNVQDYSLNYGIYNVEKGVEYNMNVAEELESPILVLDIEAGTLTIEYNAAACTYYYGTTGWDYGQYFYQPVIPVTREIVMPNFLQSGSTFHVYFDENGTATTDILEDGVRGADSYFVIDGKKRWYIYNYASYGYPQYNEEDKYVTFYMCACNTTSDVYYFSLYLYMPENYSYNGEAGVSTVVVDDNSNAPVEYFNLQGVRVANPENGLYIRRQGNKATKVLVK